MRPTEINGSKLVTAINFNGPTFSTTLTKHVSELLIFSLSIVKKKSPLEEGDPERNKEL